MQEFYAAKEANKPVDPKLFVKQQFVMNKNQSVKRKLQNTHALNMLQTLHVKAES